MANKPFAPSNTHHGTPHFVPSTQWIQTVVSILVLTAVFSPHIFSPFSAGEQQEHNRSTISWPIGQNFWQLGAVIFLTFLHLENVTTRPYWEAEGPVVVQKPVSNGSRQISCDIFAEAEKQVFTSTNPNRRASEPTGLTSFSRRSQWAESRNRRSPVYPVLPAPIQHSKTFWVYLSFMFVLHSL